jgi:hypothetical protein
MISGIGLSIKTGIAVMLETCPFEPRATNAKLARSRPWCERTDLISQTARPTGLSGAI